MKRLLKKIKVKLKRLYRFCSKGGLRYLSFIGLSVSFKWQIKNVFRLDAGRKIYWIGPFSPIHANIGDQAQTLAVQKFLQDKFNDYKIIRIYRDDINVKRLTRLSKSLKEPDLVLLHSSGDFGSLHDVVDESSLRLTFPEVRRFIAQKVTSNRIINLPVTAYYEDNETGRLSLHKDRKVFNNSDFTILCREGVSLSVIRENLTCKSTFFPDFVFYLKPQMIEIVRSGILIILRSDKESNLSSEQKEQLKESLKTIYSDVKIEDILHAAHVIPDIIRDSYMDSVFEEFQKRELVITDKMHGMIIAVITKTPCIAINGGIPHKILAYKSILSGAVEFVDDVSEIGDAIGQIQSYEYRPVDLSEYFERFREFLQ